MRSPKKISTIFKPFLATFTLFHFKKWPYLPKPEFGNLAKTRFWLLLVNNSLCSIPGSGARSEILKNAGDRCGCASAHKNDLHCILPPGVPGPRFVLRRDGNPPNCRSHLAICTIININKYHHDHTSPLPESNFQQMFREWSTYTLSIKNAETCYTFINAELLRPHSWYSSVTIWCGGGGEGVGGWSMPSLTGFNIELFKVVKTQ